MFSEMPYYSTSSEIKQFTFVLDKIMLWKQYDYARNYLLFNCKLKIKKP